LSFLSSYQYDELLRKAYRIATYSPDPSTQNGAFVMDKNYTVLGQACNDFTKGFWMPEDDPRSDSGRRHVTPEMLERPLKYSYVEHAERGAIYNTLKNNYEQPPVAMVCPWAACADCARAIVMSGITTLIRHKQASDRSPDRWKESIALADDILRVGRVDIVDVDAPSLFDANTDDAFNKVTILHCGERWKP